MRGDGTQSEADTSRPPPRTTHAGTLFWQIDIDTNYFNFYGVQFFTIMLMGFSSLPQLSLVHRNIKTFYKQRDAHFFSAAPFGLSLSVVQIPQQIGETLVFCSFVYWFTGMAPSAAKYFTFMLLVFCNTLAIGSVFRSVAAWTPRLEIANGLAMVVMMFFIILSGFSILRPSIPDYVIWLYWVRCEREPGGGLASARRHPTGRAPD